MNAFPLLQVSGITFSRGPQRLLAPITFTLQRGEFVWLTGPSGAGKTTLLKILASLLEPTAAGAEEHVMVTFMLIGTASLATIIAAYLAARRFYTARAQLK